jgi:hypothetical protein
MAPLSARAPVSSLIGALESSFENEQAFLFIE